MSEYSWNDVYDTAVAAFDETPSATVEQTILNWFKREPERVAHEIGLIAAGVHSGRVRSGWAVLMSKQAAPPRDVTVVGTAEREQAIQQAETWMRTTGLHYDRASEVLEQLFEHGPLRDYGTVNVEPGPPSLSAIEYLWSHDPSPQLAALEQTMAAAIGYHGGFSSVHPTFDIRDRYDNDGTRITGEPASVTITGDDGLADRMLDLWAELRPAGMQLEYDQTMRLRPTRANPPISDIATGRALVKQLRKQGVNMATIEATLQRGIPDPDLCAELVDYAYDLA